MHRSEDEIMRDWKCRKPLVSIICITYNHASFITKALEGFLAQECDFAFEILIHDDCSSDGTKEIIEQYAKRYPRIIKPFFEEENQYQKGSEGRYFFGELCKMAGKYIATCEGDDYWDDTKKLQIQVDFLEHNPRFVVCYHACKVIDSNGKVDSSWANFDYRDGSGYEMQRLRLGLPFRCVVYRNVIDYDEPNLAKYAKKIQNGDTFLWTLLGGYGDAKYLKEIKPAFYRIHEGGVWSMIDEKSRHIMHVKSFFNMSEYFASSGNADLASYFLGLAIHCLSFASSIDKMRYEDFSAIPKSILATKTIYGGGLSVLLLLGVISPRFYSYLRKLKGWLKAWKEASSI